MHRHTMRQESQDERTRIFVHMMLSIRSNFGTVSLRLLSVCRLLLVVSLPG